MGGALITAVGALLPWVHAYGNAGQANVFWEYNLLVVVGAITIAVLARAFGAVAALPVASLVAAGIALALYTLPGSVTASGDYGQAELTWGAGIALLGAVISLGAGLKDFSARLVAP